MVEEASVGIKLRHIPHHHSAEGGEVLAVGDGGLQVGTGGVTASSTAIGGDTEEQFYVGVLGSGLGPVVPDIHVEGILGRSAGLEVVDTTPVVVELDQEEVERDSASQSRTIAGIRVNALGSSGEIHLGSRSIHQGAKLGTKGSNVAHGAFEVEIKTIDNSVAEGSVNARASFGTKHVEHVGRSSFGIGSAAPSSLSVGGTSERQQDGLAVLGLAFFDVSLKLRAVKNVSVIRERGAVVSGVSKVDDGRSNAVHEGNWDDINLAVWKKRVRCLRFKSEGKPR